METGKSIANSRCTVFIAITVTLAVLAAPAAAVAGGDANRAQCGPETEASPGFRTYLPDCRAYELVTPPYKAGAVVLDEAPEPAAISADGDHVITGAGGAFASAGNEWSQANRNPDIDAYELTRTTAGWEPAVLTPATTYPHSAIMAASAPDLSATLWGATTTTVLFNEDIYLRDSSGEFLSIGPGIAPELAGEEPSNPGEQLEFAGASRDLTRSLFRVQASGPNELAAHNGHNDLWPGDTTEPQAYSLYEYVYADGPSAEPTLVGVKNEAALKSDTEAQLIGRCGTELGTSHAGGSAYNAVSEGGEDVFFTARACGGAPPANELYARIGAAKTIAISEPSKEDCEVCNTTTELRNAIFQGASQNGQRVFFLTEQKLLTGQEGMNLYEYDFNGPAADVEHPRGRIALVSGGSAKPEVQGVVRVSEDGSHVYFVAKGKLTGADTVAGRGPETAEPQQGADNLYVYDTVTEKTVFVATLLTSAEEASISAAEAAERAAIEAEALPSYFEQVEAAERRLSRGEISAQEFRTLEEEAREAYETRLLTASGTLGPNGTLAEDRSMWQLGDRRPVQATPDGRFLVFLSSAHLTTGDDSHLVPQLFEYDAAEEKLTRVSIGQDGTYNSDGTVDTFHDAPQIPCSRSAKATSRPPRSPVWHCLKTAPPSSSRAGRVSRHRSLSAPRTSMSTAKATCI